MRLEAAVKALLREREEKQCQTIKRKLSKGKSVTLPEFYRLRIPEMFTDGTLRYESRR